MRILLVNPTSLDAEGRPRRFQKAFLPPLSLAILAALTEPQHEVRVVDEVAAKVDTTAAWDLVALTAMTSQAERAYQLADQFRARGAKVVLGGIHATMLPDEALGHADAVVLGEAEDVWEHLVADAEAGRLQARYRSDEPPGLGRLVVPRFGALDLDSYPRPAGRRLPMLPIFTTRGCPFNCDFCSVTRAFGRTFRTKPVANVIKEIQEVRGEFYFFVDDNIVGNPDYSRELFTALAPLRVPWMSQASTTLLKNPDLIEKAAAAGCEMLYLGLESIDQATLSSVHKSFNDPAAYAELFDRLRKAGIIPYASVIFGFDGETADRMRATSEFLLRHKVGHATFYLLTPLPGTALYERFEAEGRIRDRCWSHYDLNHVVFEPRGTTPERLADDYWDTFQGFYSIGSIARRMLYDVSVSPRPLQRLLKDLGVNSYFRRMVNDRVHPYSGGLNPLPPAN